MIKTVYRLYYWFGGFIDDHKLEGTFNSMEELIKSHKGRRNTPLDNFPDFGNDYVEKYMIEEEPKKRIYMPERND